MGALFLQAPPPDASQRVELGPASEFARFPFRRDPALLLQLVQGRIKRSIANLEHSARDLLQTLAHSPAVKRPQSQNLEYQQVQSALYEIGRLAHRAMSSVTEIITQAQRKSNSLGSPMADAAGAAGILA